MNNKKKLYKDYLNRWQLVKEREDQEMREATFDLLFKQTLSVWDIGRSLSLYDESQASEYVWSDLQKKWIKVHARE